MKNLIASLLLLLALPAWAQKHVPVELDIHSSTVCDMCKSTIEKELIYEKGVKSVSVELATSTIHVVYDDRKTDPAKVRLAVTKLGYGADEMPPDMAARAALPACCQKEGCGLPAEKK